MGGAVSEQDNGLVKGLLNLGEERMGIGRPR